MLKALRSDGALAATRAALKAIPSRGADLTARLLVGPDRESPSLAPFRRQRTTRQRQIRRTVLLLAIALIGLIYGFAVSILPFSFYFYMAAPIGLGALLVIWALPDSDTYPARTLEALFFAIFIATFVWPNYLAIALPGLPWITITRLLGLPMLVVLMVSLSISSEFRRRIGEAFETTPILRKSMLAFVFFQVITLPMSGHLADSLNAFLNAQFAWTALFFLAAYVFLKPERPRIWIWLLCAIALFLCLLALAESRVAQVLWAGEVPAILSVPDESVQRIMQGGRRSALGIYRLQAVFSTSLNYAEFIGLCTPFFLYILASRRHHILVRLAVLAYLPFSFWVIRGTDSRLGVVAFFSSIMIYLLLWSVKVWRHNPRNLAAPAMVLAYPAMAGFFFALTFFWNRLSVMVWGGGAQQASTEGRKEQYANAMPKIFGNPFGNGIGEGAVTLGDTNRVGVLTIDSYYLVLALEYGVLGFIAYATLVFAATGHAVRYGLASTSRESDMLLPAAVFLVVFVIVKGVLAQDDNHSLVFIILGMIAALAHRVNLERQSAHAPARAG